jgi:uncharacterized membrane protein YsdA (DUF1294 family)
VVGAGGFARAEPAGLLRLLAGQDAAQQGRWRIREDTLHFWSLAGGWAGAWFAQQVLRHKSRKASFLASYWGTVVLHCAALAGWLGWSARGG